MVNILTTFEEKRNNLTAAWLQPRQQLAAHSLADAAERVFDSLRLSRLIGYSMVMMLSEMEMPNNVVPHLSQYLFARKHKAVKSFCEVRNFILLCITHLQQHQIAHIIIKL